MKPKKIKRSSITKGGINPQPEETARPDTLPPSALKSPLKPEPPPLVDQFGEQIGKPIPEWRISLICWGLAILVGVAVVIIGISI